MTIHPIKPECLPDLTWYKCRVPEQYTMILTNNILGVAITCPQLCGDARARKMTANGST